MNLCARRLYRNAAALCDVSIGTGRKGWCFPPPAKLLSEKTSLGGWESTRGDQDTEEKIGVGGWESTRGDQDAEEKIGVRGWESTRGDQNA